MLALLATPAVVDYDALMAERTAGPQAKTHPRTDICVQDIRIEDILDVVRQYWGFSSLRPLQEAAIRAGLERRDSLVVLPTGGGKSLCYQVPPLMTGTTDVVVSPLISLMKDQVDGLQACGYPAVALHSGMSAEVRRQTNNDILARHCRLIFVAPERLMAPGFQSLLSRIDVRAFAIDEAHCISHWGHDFRPEYRQLAELKERFPGASLHAYTATATERVRVDIAEQLGLTNPALLVGRFDRPNLVYRVVPRVDARRQVYEVIQRHQSEAVIVYCISRRDTESMSAFLQGKGVRADHYHAGLEAEDRRKVQDAFADENLDVVVATVAFGMGIDRSNVRCVVHAAMPKSIEHYQQETGRAGRDGLEAECVLFYSPADVMKWTSLLTKSAEEAGCSEDVIRPQLELLEHLRAYCQPFQCRHRRLVEYFGQSYDGENCQACDVCLDECQNIEDATVTAQKILSCVARTGQMFGAKHVADVLAGGDTDMIRKWNHQELSTHGLMAGTPRKKLSNLINQLVDQRLLDRTTDGFHTLRLNAASWEVMRGSRTVRMQLPPERTPRSSRRDRSDDKGWIGVDRGLFESLRVLRKRIADQRHVPPFVIFSDASLRLMARRKPTTTEAFLAVNGVGQKKLADFGEAFLTCIESHARQPVE
ncbi:MAG: DNA helicase RecQ [Planctomycetota bacterium]